MLCVRLIGRSLGLASVARPSVCPCVSYWRLTPKQNGAEKPKLMRAFRRAGVIGVSLFSSRDVKGQA